MNDAAADAPAVRMPMAKAINTGLRQSMERDAKVMLMGEDIGTLGGVFRVTDGLQKDFGSERVVDTPLAESGIIGTAIGLAMAGYRPVCEIQFDGFIFPGFNQITTQLAKLNYRSRGSIRVPVVIRVPFGGNIGAIEHHSESPEALFAHTPGLRVVSPAAPADAFAMIQQAISCPDPVLFLEPKARYWEKADVPAAVPEQALAAQPDLNTARIAREGSQVTVAAYGPSVGTALRAATAAQEEGISLEVIDLRTVSPIDFQTIADSVRRTGRLVVVHEAPVFHGVGGEIAARISTECFYHLEAPVSRVGGLHTPYPVAKLEGNYLPDLDRVLHAVDEVLAH